MLVLWMALFVSLAPELPEPDRLTRKELSVTGEIQFLFQEVESGILVRAETLKLVSHKNGKSATYPLDIQARQDLAALLINMRHRELTLLGNEVDGHYETLGHLPLFSGPKLLKVPGRVFRIREVRVDYDKLPLAGDN